MSEFVDFIVALVLINSSNDDDDDDDDAAVDFGTIRNNSLLAL